MNSDQDPLLTELEIDTLQELMNISFGQAAADLAETTDIFIELCSPVAVCISADKILPMMKKTVPDFQSSTVVEQHYYGEIKGIAVLLFPEGTDVKLTEFFHDYNARQPDAERMLKREKEVIIEVGNILLGACLGSLFRTLKSSTTYLPPWINPGGVYEDIFLAEIVKPDDITITMSVSFQFEEREISGHLFLVNSFASMEKIQKALADYWTQYDLP